MKKDKTRILLFAVLLFALVFQAQAEGAKEEERTLVVAVSGAYESFDPLIGGSPRTTEIVASVYSFPVGFKTEQVGEYTVQALGDEAGWVAELAEEVAMSDDFSRITFKLRRGVRFYPSGNEMTSEDWLWSWERQLSEPAIGFGRFMNSQAGITSFDSIEAMDRYTVRITLDIPNPRALAFIRLVDFAILDSAEVKRHATDEDPWAVDWLSTHSAGCGPYYIASRIPGNELVLERNPLYWGEMPYFERILFKIVPDTATRVALIRSGEVDIAQNIPAREAENLTRVKGVRVLSIPSGNRVALGMNLEQTPWKGNLALRQAVAYAVPFPDIIDTAFFGQARRYRSYVLEGIPGYSGREYDYDTDLDRARELLDEAGYPEGLRVTLTVNSAFPQYETAAVLLQDSLGRIGIDVRIERLQAADFVGRWFSKQLNFFIHDGVAWIDDPSFITGLWLETGAFSNYTLFSDPRVDEIQQTWRWEADSPQRRAAYVRAQDIYNLEVSTAYLALNNFILVTGEDVEGYVLYKDTNTRYQDLRR